MSKKSNKQNIDNNKIQNNKKDTMRSQNTLNEIEMRIVAQKKFGFDLMDVVFAILIGAICFPLLFSFIGGMLLGIVSIFTGLESQTLLDSPIIYAFANCLSTLGIGSYVWIVISKKNKKMKEKAQGDTKVRSVIFKKCKTLPVIFVVLIPVICLIFLSGFVNLTSYGLSALGYSKSMDLPIVLDNIRNYLLSIIFLCGLPAIMEEFLFRGVILGGLLNNAKSNASRIAFVFLSALIFALCHQSAGQFVYPLIMGVVFGFVYMITGNIWYSVICHFVSNSLVITLNFIQNIFNIPIADMGINALSIIIAFVCLIVFVLCIYFVFKYMRKICKNQSTFDLINCEIDELKIQENLCDDKEDLKYLSTDGIELMRKSKLQKDKMAKVFLGLTIVLLVIIVVADLVSYCM